MDPTNTSQPTAGVPQPNSVPTDQPIIPPVPPVSEPTQVPPTPTGAEVPPAPISEPPVEPQIPEAPAVTEVPQTQTV